MSSWCDVTSRPGAAHSATSDAPDSTMLDDSFT
jgi:hypothetical protein